MPWIITVLVGPGACPVCFREHSHRPILPRAEPGHAVRGEGREWVQKIMLVFSVLPVSWLPRLLLGSKMESHGRYEDHDHFQAPAMSQTIMCLGSGVPHVPGIGFFLPLWQTLHQGVLCLCSHFISTDILLFFPCRTPTCTEAPVPGREETSQNQEQ